MSRKVMVSSSISLHAYLPKLLQMSATDLTRFKLEIVVKGMRTSPEPLKMW